MLFLFNHLHASEEIFKKEAKFGNWSVFIKKKRDLCYMMSAPKKSVGDYKKRGRVNLVIAEKKGSQNKSFIGIDFGYKLLKNQKARLEIDGKKIIELDTFDQTAWMQSEKNMKKRKKLINEMKMGYELKVVARSQRGTTTKDYYTLLGFTNAYNKIKKMCK